ncbi:MAG: hypothetical protein ACE5D2_04460, partial [Fidelibacterota bacterium]
CTEIDKSMQPALPSQVTYVEHIQPILERSCVRCHNEDVNHYGVILTSYERVKVLSQIEVGNPNCVMLTKVLSPEIPDQSETGWMYRFLEEPRDYELIYQWIVKNELMEK